VTSEMQLMKAYIEKHLVRAGTLIEENTNLVSSGLIDSLGLTDIIMKLEDILKIRIPASKIHPEDLDTLTRMFATASRVGKPLG
jgi:acyl carrier protein